MPRHPQHMPARDRHIGYLRLADIRGADVNPKGHDQSGIARSITEHGLAELPLLDERTGRIVAGHGRIDDLRSRKAVGNPPPDGVGVDDDGEWLVPVQSGWASKSDAHARAYLAASNKLSENGGWDKAVLGPYLSDLNAHDMLELTGFTADELDELLDTGAGGADDPAPPEIRGAVDQRARDVIAQVLLDELGDLVGWDKTTGAAAGCVVRLRGEGLLADDE